VPERINDSLEREGGVVAHKSMFSLSDHPVCAASVAAGQFLDRAATPPHEGNNIPGRPAFRIQQSAIADYRRSPIWNILMHSAL